MAEEGNLGVARALNTDEVASKADLQHRIDEARESITETVAEIKESAVNQYDSVKESVTEALDWREQVRKHPVACSVGALGIGIMVGYGLAGLIERDDEVDNASSEQLPRAHVQVEGGGPSAFTDQHSYAAHARAVARVDNETASSEDEKVGLIHRFKETRVYDRLQEEVADLGIRFMDELAGAARTIVLPALFNKLRELIGVDLSNKRRSSNTESQKPVVDATAGAQTPSAGRHQPPAASEGAVIRPSEVGKPAYPRTDGSLNKFDRVVSDTPAPSGQTDNSPHINLNYDDRYERESKLFSRGEIRGFAASKPGENKPLTNDVKSTDRDDVPLGKDFTFEPGRADNS